MRWKIDSYDQVLAMDGDELVEGYRDGLHGEPEPGDNRSPAFWHGWRNGASDRGLRAIDADQRKIAAEAVARMKAGIPL